MSKTATLTLTQTWVNLFDDPSQYVVLTSTTQRESRATGQGDIVSFGARNVYVDDEQDTAQTTFTGRTRDADVLTKLRAWRRRRVIVRDGRGRRAVGVYVELVETDTAPDWTDVQIVLGHISDDITA